ncbi:MAG: hypothetical protein LBE92_15260 [Chryseobacterium sp.]|jgi:hypothetical protein|uniref:hypothetical protein n=1 Tax=Chryseobacterium sp. TaxID=1871047 RepID=UPI002818B24C|nr:hypothetical protein [Chryseobacterium sp.]MDR2237479.1 hypothetical protein [Chryseobacterium sp.]
MKNLKKLTKRELRMIGGGALLCPAPATTCAEWCTWTADQRRRCRNMVMDPEPCGC